MLVFTLPQWKYWERKDGIITGWTDRQTDRQTKTQLTLLPPYVIIFSVWVVVGLCHCFLGRPVDRPSVQQLFLSPWHYAFSCQLLGLLGNATEFLGIWLLVGQHTGEKAEKRRLSADCVQQEEVRKQATWHQI